MNWELRWYKPDKYYRPCAHRKLITMQQHKRNIHSKRRTLKRERGCSRGMRIEFPRDLKWVLRWRPSYEPEFVWKRY